MRVVVNFWYKKQVVSITKFTCTKDVSVYQKISILGSTLKFTSFRALSLHFSDPWGFVTRIASLSRAAKSLVVVHFNMSVWCVCNMYPNWISAQTPPCSTLIMYWRVNLEA